jgi:CHC2-type zinc finger protein
MAADGDQTRRFLGALHGWAPPGSLVEVRFRLGPGMGQRFVPAQRLGRVADRIASLAASTDVFVGVIARAHHGGSRSDLVQRAAVVWVDCDDHASVAALARFRPLPSIVVASGSGSNQHAYWLLSHPVGIEEIERANHRLALTLGADLHCGDGARIMRPAGTTNRKHSPPTAVRLLACDQHARIALADLTAGLAPNPAPTGRRATERERPPASDPLLALAPRLYVERLLGQPVTRSGKVSCPFHEDGTPSLHAYDEPGRGWYCFGCGLGGSVYDLAALLWSIPPSGRGFVELRERLTAALPCHPPVSDI